MKKKILLSLLGLIATMPLFANYTDIPYEVTDGRFTVDGYQFSTEDGYYQEWDHYVIFWSVDYGTYSADATQIGSGDYLLNLSGMKTYAEQCYTSYTHLGFLNPMDFGHKIIILAYYSTDWFATGSGYGEYGVLNIAHSSANPSAENPYYTFCHEIAHAYQYLGNFKNGGNAGFQYGDYYGYVSYYENCANWQANQIYPELHFAQLSPVFIKTTNLAFLNQWHCYQSYPMNDYFTEKRSADAVGKIWTINTNTRYADASEKYMQIYGLTANDLYKDFFWAAMRMTTWDLDTWQNHLSAANKKTESYMDHTPGTKAGRNATSTPNTYNDNCWRHASTFQYVTLDSDKAEHQVAYSSCPQSTGFNCIKLNVPTGSNRTVTTSFTALPTGSALASGDNKEYWTGSMWATSSNITKYNTSQTAECNSNYNEFKNWRGFRLGYVGYNKSTGERFYNYTDEVFCTGDDESTVNVQFTVPEGVDSLYWVVSPALSQYLRMGSTDPYNISSDADYLAAQQACDQWPYKVQFFNTNIYGLTNPPSSFSGDAKIGNTYTSATLPDMGSGESVVDPEEPKEEVVEKDPIELTREVSFPAETELYTGTSFALTSEELDSISTLFGVDADFLKNANNWEAWSESGLTKGKLSLRPVKGNSVVDQASTANGYGYWFNSDGDVCAYNDNSVVYTEYDEKEATFTVGQMPGTLSGGNTGNLAVAIVYNNSGKQYYVIIRIQITIEDVTLLQLIESEESLEETTHFNVLGGRVEPKQPGIHIVKYSDGRVRKIYVE